MYPNIYPCMLVKNPLLYGCGYYLLHMFDPIIVKDQSSMVNLVLPGSFQRSNLDLNDIVL